jgi:N-acetylglucosamine repressor
MYSVDLRKEILSEKEKRSIDILEIVRRRGPISRPEISKEMGINVVTISNYIDEFIRRNIVYEKELDVSEGGRRPVLLDLNPQSGYVIGVGLNLMNMVGVLVDMKGNIVTKTQVTRPKASVKEIAECLLEIVREILRRSKEHTAHIKGIGVGIAGLINKENGSVFWPNKDNGKYTYASVEVPLQELIEKEFNIPTLIENDATSACFGEHWLDLERGYRHVLYMFSGVGCGIMMNGELYRGANGYAGELSISNYREQDLFSCAFGQTCFLKSWEMDLGIVDEVRKAIGEDVKTAEWFASKYLVTAQTVDLKNVFDAAHSGNPRAQASLHDAGKRLGIKISFLINLLNPEVVVIGGGFEDAGDSFLNTVSTTVRSWAFREAVSDLEIVYSQLRENAVALGAASLVTQKIFAQVW